MDLVVELADESGKGSPAKLLEAIKNNEELIRNTLDKNVGIALEGRAEILKELGIFVPVELSTGRCRFADMMHGPDEDYTKTLINRIMPLLNRAIPEEKMPATRELIKAEILDQINCEQVKAIPEGRVLWHIIDRNVIPRPQQDSIITQLNKFYRDHPEANEKILIVDEAKLAQEIAGIREKDDGAIIDVALSDRAQLDAYESLLRENNARPLVFQSEGNFIQFEGVIAALRALESGDLGALLRIYSVMTGKPFNSPPEAIFDPIKFARSFIFDLPRAASVPVDDIPKLNKRLLQLLIAA